MIRKAISRGLTATAHYAARAYIPGVHLEDAMQVCAGDPLGKFCICLWDCAQDSKELVAAGYFDALDAIEQSGRDIYLSVKVPSLRYDAALIRSLAERAARSHIRLHFDSMAPESAGQILELAAQLSGALPNIGITLPSRWLRSISDAERFSAARVAIRIVKGQWSDPAFDDRRIDHNFEAIVETLSGRQAVVAVASHDASLAERALTTLATSGTPCELEQLYGLPLVTGPYLSKISIPVRVYVPYGAAYLPYAVSAVKKRPVVLWWLVRDAACSGLSFRRRDAAGHHAKSDMLS